MGAHESYSAQDLVVAHQNEVVQAPAQNRLRQCEARPHRETRNPRATGVARRLSGSPGTVRGGCGAGLHPDDPAVGGQRVAHQAGPCRPGSGADRHVDGSQIAMSAEELQIHGGVPEDDRRLVARRHQSHPLRSGQAAGMGEGVAHGLALNDHPGAQGANRGDLAGRGARRYDDGHRRAPAGSRPGQGLGVVASGGGDHAAAPLLLAESRHERHPAAHLEGAGRLDVLMLDDDVDSSRHGEEGV